MTERGISDAEFELGEVKDEDVKLEIKRIVEMFKENRAIWKGEDLNRGGGVKSGLSKRTSNE